MIKKLAVLVIEKADGAVEIRPGEKGDIYAAAREEKRRLNGEALHDVARLTAFGSDGIIIQAKWKCNLPVEVVAPIAEVETGSVEEIVVDEDLEQEVMDSSADVAAIRAALKAKDVKVPPRISVDKLIEMAIAHGVEV